MSAMPALRVSDLGAPSAALQAVGLRSIPPPGASSVDIGHQRGRRRPPAQAKAGFALCRLCPPRMPNDWAAVQKLADQPRCTVLLEAPHRIIESWAPGSGPCHERRVTLAREITKQFEDIASMPPTS